MVERFKPGAKKDAAAGVPPIRRTVAKRSQPTAVVEGDLDDDRPVRPAGAPRPRQEHKRPARHPEAAPMGPSSDAVPAMPKSDAVEWDFDKPAHPLTDLIPPMGSTALESLTASIRASGLLEPITLLEGQVLDGRARLLACREAGEEPRFKNLGPDEEPRTFLLDKNVVRRDLCAGARAMIGHRLATVTHGGQRGPESRQVANLRLADVARLVGVSQRSISTARLIAETGDEDLIEEVVRGETSLNAAERTLERRGRRRSLRFGQPPPLGIRAARTLGGLARVAAEDGEQFVKRLLKWTPSASEGDIRDLLSLLRFRQNALGDAILLVEPLLEEAAAQPPPDDDVPRLGPPDERTPAELVEAAPGSQEAARTTLQGGRP